jgi:serine/alanine adding enzyme
MLYIKNDTDNTGDIEKFLSNNLLNNIFQSVFYFRLCYKGTISKPYYIIYEENGVIKGVMLVNIQNYFGNMLKKVASRSVIIGGPVVSDLNIEVTEKIFSFYKETLPGEVIYTQIRNIYDMAYCDSLLSDAGYKRIDHLNYLIELDNSEEELWGKVYSKRRNEIRRAAKEGVQVKEIDYKTEFNISYNILFQVYSRAKLPLPYKEYFFNALNLSYGCFRIFGAYFDGGLIGFMYALCYGNRVYNWYAGSMANFHNKYPNDIITWEVIKWAKNNGYHLFDFGGAGHPKKEYGVRDFKKKFGGSEVNFGRYEFVHKPKMMKVSEYGFRAWQKLRGRNK